MVQDPVNQAVIAVTMEGAKLSGKALAEMVKLVMAAMKNHKSKIYHGKQTVKQLMKQGAKLETLDLSDRDLALFHKVMKSYGVDYAVHPMKDNNGKTLSHTLFLKATDYEIVYKALEEFSAKHATREQMEVRESLMTQLDSIKVTSKNSRLTAWRTSWLKIFRQSVLKFLDWRQPACEILVQPDKKFSSQSVHQSS